MPTDGVRQFTSLLRKNILLKCRRPCATTFELALPLLLFLLLVYVRSIYETSWYGPFFYKSNLLTPLGAGFLNQSLDSKALRDNDGDYNRWQAEQMDGGGFADPAALNTLLAESICSNGASAIVADGLEAVLRFETASGSTLAEELLRVDPMAVGQTLTAGLNTTWLFLTDGSAVTEGERLREDFFNSGLDVATSQVAARVQREADALVELLNAPDGPEQAGRLAERWFEEACAADLGALLGSSPNLTALSDLLWNVGRVLEDTGVAELLRFTSNENENVENVVSDSLRSVVGNMTQANSSLVLGDLFSQLAGLQDQAGFSEQLSSLLQQAQALNELGLDRFSVQGLMGALALGSLGLTPGARLPDLTEFLGGSAVQNLNLLALAFQQISDLRPLVQYFDIAAWWTSHFLRERSLTALLLGRAPWSSPLEGPNRPSGRNPLGPGGMLGNDGGEPFSTEAAFSLLEALQGLQSQGPQALFGLEAASLIALFTAGSNPIVADLWSFISRITNTTPAEIERSVLPSLLNRSNASACSDETKASVGRLMARTHERCPFYRAVLPELAGGRLSSGLQAAQNGFQSLNFSQLDQDMKRSATSLPMALNETVIEVLVRAQADFGYNHRVYEQTSWQQYCPSSMTIETAIECKIAATSMGKRFGGTIYEEGGHQYCMYGPLEEVYFNPANASATPPMLPYGSVCRAEKWQNYTKTYELIGNGFCRPEGCNPAARRCRVNGYYGNALSLLECRRACEREADCIGFSFMPQTANDIEVTGCFIHTNTTVVPAGFIRYAYPHASINGSSGSSLGMCYRVAEIDPSQPTTSGCYFKQPTAGNGNCRQHQTWTADTWGRENRWSWDNEALCLERKRGHDAWCGASSSWLYVHNPADQALTNTHPRAVAEHLTWLLAKELLFALELPRCERVPLQSQRPESSEGRRRGGDGRRRTRRLQAEAQYIRKYLGRRKVLIAPYKGEVRELIDMVTVEALLSGLEDGTSGTKKNVLQGFLGLLTQCPLVRGLTGTSALQLLEENLLFLDSPEEVQDFARRRPDDVLLAVVFTSADSEGNFPASALNVDFSIRAHAQLLPSTSRMIRQSRNGGWRGMAPFYFYPYIDLGFAQIEELVGLAAARLQARREARGNPRNSVIGQNIAANERTEPGRRMRVSLEQFPVGRTELDNFFVIIQFFMPMLLVLGWIYAVSLMVREVVYEKQERLRDVMRIQGLKTWVYWLSWLTSGMVQLTGLVLLLVLLLSVGKVVENSDPTVLFVFFWLYSLSTVSFAMFISSFFSRAKVAAAFGGLLYWLAYMPSALFNQFEETLSFEAKNAFCLLSPTALGVGMLYVGKWETLDVGAQWSNLWTVVPITTSGAAPKDNHSLGTVLGMMILDSILYQVLAWYVEKVRPGTLGLPQPWYFPFLTSYWWPRQEFSTMASAIGHEQSGNELECWEEPSAEVTSKVSVQIRNLSKTFSNGKQALKGITLDMHQGTILGLLGHNGAGKSTTMSIMTGLYPPSSGDVVVHGVSVRGDSLGVRRQLGVCLQHNALYENVTVEEHLRLFCLLKSVPHKEVAAEVDRLLRDTGMEAKRRAPSRALSGGMKRKLSIAIALAGGSKVVTLDEPTAGVDATARRDIWHLLVKYKVGRTILLSTHFMDEADILSDRIAIIAEGRLTAIASSMTLKRHFADGYLLTVVCEDQSEGRKLAAFVTGTVPSSCFAGARGREFCFALPFNSQAIFPILFEKLQDNDFRKELKVNAYGLSAASMEEVFLKASSVHEKGLHGQVRNVAFDAGEERPAPTLPFSAGLLEADGQILERDDKANTPKAGESIGATPIVLGMPIKQKEKASVEDEDVPQSPQCMTSHDPQTADTPAMAATPVAEEEYDHQVPLVRGPRLWCQQFDALFRKRALSVRRDRRAWASQLLLPAIFVFLALLIARILEVRVDEPPLRLSTDMLSGTVWAGSAREIDAHVIPFSKELRGELAERVYTAFNEGKGAGDRLDLVGGDSNLTMGKFLFENRDDLGTSYGAISLSGESDGQANLTMWFKREAYHAVPIMVNLWANARMQLLGMEESTVQVTSHPLPKSQQLVQEEMSGGSQVLTDLFVALTVILAMGFIPASFLVYLVHEKSTNGKHQQLLTGISPLLYWFGNYCWDVVNFLLPLLLCLVIFQSFQVMAYSGDNLPAIVLVLFLYGACMTPLMYCVEPFFSVPSTAYVTLICLNIFTGTISTLAIAVLEAFDDQPELRPILEFGRTVFPWALPNYGLGRSLLAIAVNHYANFAYTEFGVCVHDNGTLCWKSPLSWDVTGEYMAKLVAMVPVWFFLRMLIEWSCFLRGLKKRFIARALAGALSKPTESVMDEAVLAEQVRVEAELQRGKADGLVLDKLEKCFARQTFFGSPVTFRAVRGISVGVPAGECFGLLGVNGAGKTTTMRMITGDTEVTKGDILVGGASVQTQRDAARRRLGYCPQFDAIPDKLTVRETIQLFARIRGIPRSAVVGTADTMIAKMCLEAHEHQLCEYLSGGNKRKLSTALALIGEPDVVLLDEPSTGVDVGARRFLWEVIGNIRRSGHAVVLTSHSMEECEVLCTRLTIMVAGQFRCLGSPIELKARYGGGYSLSVKSLPGKDSLSSTEDNLAQIREFVKSKVPWARLAEVSVGLLRYRLSLSGDQELPLAEVFRKLEDASRDELKGCISDYSISQTSLEEVFLHFSREAGTAEDPEIKLEDVDDTTYTPSSGSQEPMVIGAAQAETEDAPPQESEGIPASQGAGPEDQIEQRKASEPPEGETNSQEPEKPAPGIIPL